MFFQSFSTSFYNMQIHCLRKLICVFGFEIHCLVTTCLSLSHTGEKWGQNIWNREKKMTANEHPGIFRSPVVNKEISFGFFILQTSSEVWTPLWLGWKWQFTFIIVCSHHSGNNKAQAQTRQRPCAKSNTCKAIAYIWWTIYSVCNSTVTALYTLTLK